MDAVAALLDGPRARGAFLLRSTLTAPWAMRIEDGAPLTLIACVTGSAAVVRDGAVFAMAAGDVAIVCGPTPYIVADVPETVPEVVIGPGQVCTSPDGTVLGDMQMYGVRAWGNDPDGETVLLTGTYQSFGEVSKRLLAALPATLVVSKAEWDNPLVEFLADEMARTSPGQEAILDRVLDLLLLGVVRVWLARPSSNAPGWYAAHNDPIVGPALQLMQHRPEEPWTLDSLATATHVSRATFARQFAALVGEPPMSFLTSWRVSLAADLLLEDGATLASVANKVGYSSPFALSAAFKRVRGQSPREHREARSA